MDFDLNEEWCEIFSEHRATSQDLFDPLGVFNNDDPTEDEVHDEANLMADELTADDFGPIQVDGEDLNFEQGEGSNVPQVGMVFSSVDEAFDFYDNYGYSTGFGVIKRSCHKRGKELYDQSFSCNKYRQSDVETSDSKPIVRKRKRGIVSTHCKAGITIKDAHLTGEWVISKVILEHNHDFVPHTVNLISTNRKIPERFKKELQSNEDEGMPINVNIKSVISHAGGFGNCTFIERDARNFLDGYRKDKLRKFGGDDAVAILDYFDKKKLRDENFHSTFNCTSGGHLWNILWSDGRGKSAYKYFNDVLIVDATYLKNRYDMPVVLLGGCNHHFQTIVFAVALLSKESEEGYTWVFQKFLDCMKGVKPKGILTDQCPSMELGIKNVFGSDTVHRYCSWHILNKLPTKWGRDNSDGWTDIVKSVVYDSLTPGQFKENWKLCMEKLGCTNDEWFTGLYKMRARWVPAYLNDQFWAGMTTTQRVESLNSFLKNYLTNKCTLREFVEYFDNALRRLWQREHEADHESKYKERRLITKLTMEKQFDDVYTTAIFYKCQTEMNYMINLHAKCEFQEDECAYYVVTDLSNKRTFQVLYDRVSKEACCICRFFETMGLVCCHLMQVWKEEGVDTIPEKYLIDRWKQAFKRSNLAMPDMTYLNSNEDSRYSSLYRAANPVIEDILEFGSVDEQTGKEVMNALVGLRSHMSGSPLSQTVVGDDTLRGRGRGRGRSRGGRGRGKGRGGRGKESVPTEEEIDLADTLGRGRGRVRGRGRGRGRGRVPAENLDDDNRDFLSDHEEALPDVGFTSSPIFQESEMNNPVQMDPSAQDPHMNVDQAENDNGRSSHVVIRQSVKERFVTKFRQLVLARKKIVAETDGRNKGIAEPVSEDENTEDSFSSDGENGGGEEQYLKNQYQHEFVGHFLGSPSQKVELTDITNVVTDDVAVRGDNGEYVNSLTQMKVLPPAKVRRRGRPRNRRFSGHYDFYTDKLKHLK